MIITKLGLEALEVLTTWKPADSESLEKLRTDGAHWALECISRDHPEYGEIMDGIGRCLCGARYYPEGDAMHYRIGAILRDFDELWYGNR